jgi:hypothetical protein
MSKTTDWYPYSRTDQLVMIRIWISIMSDAAVRAAWNIPAEQFQELGALYAAAQALLQQAQSSERTPVITEQCREAFEALEAKARFFKGHYFLVPPLTNANLVDLGLRPHSTHPVPTGDPKAQAAVETYLTGRHELGLRIVFVSGDPADRANEGFRIWYQVVPPGGDPITVPEGLHQSFFTRRKKDVIVFDFADSGKTVYISVQVENGGKKGPWGPIVSSVIP